MTGFYMKLKWVIHVDFDILLHEFRFRTQVVTEYIKDTIYYFRNTV